MNSKYFFKQFKEEIAEETQIFKAKSEEKPVPSKRCDHKNKVKMIDGVVVCACGARWHGPEVHVLFELLCDVVI